MKIVMKDNNKIAGILRGVELEVIAESENDVLAYVVDVTHLDYDKIGWKAKDNGYPDAPEEVMYWYIDYDDVERCVSDE